MGDAGGEPAQLQKRIDQESARRKAAAGRHAGSAGALAQERAELEHLRAEAFSELDLAQEIYVRTDNHRGVGAARINRGFLYFDGGELDCAAVESAAAYEAVPGKARLHPHGPRRTPGQCMVENARYYASRSATARKLHWHAHSGPTISPAMLWKWRQKRRTGDCWRALTSGRD